MEQPSQKESPISDNTSSRTTGVALGALEEAPDPLITAPPELRLRNAIPEPQANDCQQASQSAQQVQQSASQAAQQASQQAQQSIQQAQQQASQAASQASASASRAITDAQNSANQSIAAATRSASAALASASSLVASVQSSASQAIASAQGRMSQAQDSQSLAQSQASSAVLQAGAAVAAATGSAAAAGSSFLAAAALATKSADASVSAIGAQASSQIQQAGVQVTASQVQAVTATQAALAIVGSVIASALITILIYFLVVRNKRKRKEAKNGRSRAQSDTRRGMPSPGAMAGYTGDTKFPTSDQDGSTVVATPSRKDTGDLSRGSDNSFSLFPKQTPGDNPAIKSTTVPWNPSKPPKAPRLQSWLNVQEVSPFGPIKLPTDDKLSKGPMGGQLKSPLRKFDNTSGPKSPFRLAMEKPVIAPEIAKAVQMQPKKPVQIVQRNVSKLSKSASPENLSRESIPKQEPGPVVMIPEEKEPTKEKAKTPQRELNPPIHAPDEVRVSYRDLVRESSASVWTDEIPYESPSTPPAAPVGPASVTQNYPMQLPTPQGPVRNTVEWLAAQTRNSTVSQDGGAGSANKGIGVRNDRGSIASRASQFPPGGRRDTQALGRMGLPSGPGPRGRAYSMKADTKPEMGQGQMSDEFDLGMLRNGTSGAGSNRSTINTPGVGKAL